MLAQEHEVITKVIKRLDPIKNKNIRLFVCILLILTILLSIALLYEKIDRSRPSQQQNLENKVYNQEARDSISAEKLVEKYQKDELSADTKYKNEIIKVTGTVARIYRELDYITLSSPAFGESSKRYNVRCNMQTKNPLLENVKTGQTVTVKGICDGRPQTLIKIGSGQKAKFVKKGISNNLQIDLSHCVVLDTH